MDNVVALAGAWRSDDDYEEYEVKSVELRREADRKVWVVSLEHDMTVEWERGGGRLQPREGDTLRFFGDLEDEFGARGIVHPEKGKLVYYRTEEEQEKYVTEQRGLLYEARGKDLAENGEEYAKRLSVLPDFCREHYAAARNESPAPGYWDVMEAREMLVLCEHAAMLHAVFEGHRLPDLETFCMIPQQSKVSSVWQTMAEDTEEAWKEENDPRLPWLQDCMERRWIFPLPTQTLDSVFGLVMERMKQDGLH